MYAELKGRSGEAAAVLPYYIDTGIPVTTESFERLVAHETDRYLLKLLEVQEVNSSINIDVKSLIRAQVSKFLNRNLLRVEVVHATPTNVDDVLEAVQSKPDFDSWCIK